MTANVQPPPPVLLREVPTEPTSGELARALGGRLAAAAAGICRVLDVQQIFAEICGQSAIATDASGAVVYLAQEGSDELLLAARWCPDSPGPARHSRRVAQAAIASDAPILERAVDGFWELAVPIHGGRDVMGALLLQFASNPEAGEEQLAIWIADVAGPAIETARMHQDVARMARIDFVSGCLNRTALHEALRAEMECARGERRPLSLLMLDLNDFKTINETHGHAAGDRVLREVGHALQAAVRPGDPVARYGGDEFAVVLPGADEVEASEIAARIVESVTDAVEDVGIPVVGQAVVGGVAQWRYEKPAELMARADRALMYAKQDKLRTPWSMWSTVPADFHPDSLAHARTEPTDALESLSDELSGANRIRRRSQQLMMVAALANKLAGQRAEVAIVRTVASELYHGLGYFQCCISRSNEDQTIERLAVSGAAFEQRLLVSRRVPKSSGVLGRTIDSKCTQLIGDVQTEPDFAPDPDGDLTRSELCVPVWVGDRVWGVLNLEERRRHAFDEHDVHVAETVAGILGAALRSAS